MKTPQAKAEMPAATIEAVTKAEQCASLLVSDICAAHRLACDSNPMLEILLRDLIGEDRKVQGRLKEIEAAGR
jgi:hypothetical protein